MFGGTSRIITLLGSILVALGAGTGYVYSAYAPQLGARLRVSHTQLNIIALAGNMGGSISGPIWGRIVDRQGPRIPLISASICLFFGYFGIKQMYDDGIGDGPTATVPALHFALLVVCGFMTGVGANGGITAAINTTAKSFPSSARATTTGLVLSGLGLSAFWFSLLGHTFFPGDTSALLLTLALGTAIPMLLGLFIVKPVPLSSGSDALNEPMIDGYDLIPSGDADVFVGESKAPLDPEADADGDIDSASLLSAEQEQSSYPVYPPAAAKSSSSAHKKCVGDEDAQPDIHGKRLLLSFDFYLAFVITGICGGTGLMYITNVGSISQALYAQTHTVYDDVEAAKWQAAQVSILSLGNFAGRILIGLISDFTYTRLGHPRAYCFFIVSLLFIISQVVAIAVSSLSTLWIATLLLGFAYGSLFGSSPTIVIEWFGLAHFSENWGFVSFSPVVWGNIFLLMFGRNLDAHSLTQSARPSLAARVWSSVGLVSRGLPSEHQCFDGKACYVGSLQVTLVACIVSLGLSWWAGIRDGRRIRERNMSSQ